MICNLRSLHLLHMRARPNLMTQTLDDMGGLVASRLRDRMQAYAGDKCARRTLREARAPRGAHPHGSLGTPRGL